MLVVAVYQRIACKLRREQAALGGKILFRRAKEVQMVVREVGERHRVIHYAIQLIERQRMRRHLHGHYVHALVGHLAQQALQLYGIGRSQVSGQTALAYHGHYGAYQTYLIARLLEYRLYQEAGGGLALGAGYAHHLHAARGMSVERLSYVVHGQARVAHDYLRHVHIQLALHDKRRRARLNRLRCKLVRVHPYAAYAKKQRARLYLA